MTRPPGRPPLTAPVVTLALSQRMVDEYVSGATMDELAARHGVCKTTVAYHLRKHAAASRRRGRSSDGQTPPADPERGSSVHPAPGAAAGETPAERTAAAEPISGTIPQSGQTDPEPPERK